jgi:hypothetical protein
VLQAQDLHVNAFGLEEESVHQSPTQKYGLTSLVGPAVHLAARDQADAAQGEEPVLVGHRGGLHAGLQVLRERVGLVLRQRGQREKNWLVTMHATE